MNYFNRFNRILVVLIMFSFVRPEQNEAYCVCEDGWTYDPKNLKAGCIDVDECAADSCGENSICTNTKGSFICQCKPGFTGNPLVRCIGNSFIHLFIYSSIHHSSMHLFIYSFTFIIYSYYSFIHLFIYIYHLFTYSFIHFFIY